MLNSDDLAEPHALGALADALDADPGADFAFGWIHFFGDVDFVARQPRLESMDPSLLQPLGDLLALPA